MSYYWNSIASPLTCPWACQLSRYVPVDAGSQCGTASLVGDRIKDTSCSVLQERTASPAPLGSCSHCKRLCAVCLHSATEPAVTRLLTCSCTAVFCTADGTCSHTTVERVPAPPCSVQQTVPAVTRLLKVFLHRRVLYCRRYLQSHDC